MCIVTVAPTPFVSLQNQKYACLKLEQLPKSSSLKSTTAVKNNTSSVEKKTRKVTFQEVHIRLFPMELGTAQSACGIGAPVSLGWEYMEQFSKDLDEYECERFSKRHTGSNAPRKFMLNYYQRRDILLKAGYSQKEIKEAEHDSDKVRRQRQVTAAMMPLCRVKEAWIKAADKCRRRHHRVAQQP